MKEPRPELRQLIQAAFKVLENKGISQVSVVNKLKTIEVDISTSTFNNIIKNRLVGLPTLLKVEAGIRKILGSGLNPLVRLFSDF